MDRKSLDILCTPHNLPWDPLTWLRPFFSCSQASLGKGLPDLQIGHPVGGRSPQALDPLTWLRLFFSCSQASLGKGLPDLRSGIPRVDTVHRPWFHSRGSGPSFPAPKQAWARDCPICRSGIPWVDAVHRPWIHSRGSGSSFPAPKQAWARDCPIADRASRGWTQSTGPGSTRVAQALLFLLPSKLGQGIARSAIGHPAGGHSPQALDPLTWLRLFFSCSQASLGRKTKNPDSIAVRACGLR
jgi:hypothetical protein